MSARFLLDTNAMREPVRENPDPAFMARFELHRHALAIPAPAWHEATFGLYRMPAGRYRDRVSEFLHQVLRPGMDVLPYDEAAAAWHAAERARLEAAGRPSSFADGLVAAVAARFDLTVVTANTRHFECFEGIRVVNWKASA